MAKRWRVVREAPQRCPIHNKSLYQGEALAWAAAKEVEARERLEPGAMDAYRCQEMKGWHIGHKSIRARLERD